MCSCCNLEMMQHKCEECDSVFKRNSRLLVHMRTHTGDRPFKCSCGRSYIRRQHLARHEAKCQGVKEDKDYCLIKPTIEKDPIDSTSYCCPRCGAGPFAKKKTVWAHISIVHGDKRFRCDECGQAYPTSSKLERHRSRHHKLDCHLCASSGLVYEAGQSGATAASALPGPMPQAFETFSKLRQHIAQHHPKSKFRCSVCDQEFSRAAHLKEHELRHTPGAGLTERRRFCCTICSPLGLNGTEEAVVAFTAKRNLNAHMRSIHSSEVRRFACPFPDCPALLSNKQKLTEHLRRHCEGEETNSTVPVRHRTAVKRPPLPLWKGVKTGKSSGRPKRQRCVPLRDLDDQWETESNSSVVPLLC